MNIFMRFPQNRAKTLTLSYDDAVQQDIRLIEIMRKHGLKGTFNVNTESFAPEGTLYPKDQIHRRLTQKEAYALYSGSGMEVAVHAATHPFLEQLPVNMCVREVMNDRENIEKMFGTICRGMAYPYGTTSDSVVQALKSCGILYSRTTVSRRNFIIPEDWLRLSATCHHKDPQLLELAQSFLAAKEPFRAPMMFYLWGHSYEFDMDNNWKIIEKFAEMMGGREEIWYATNLEIFEYIEAFRLLRTSNDGRTLFNPTAYTLYFSTGSDSFEIKPAKTLKI